MRRPVAALISLCSSIFLLSIVACHDTIIVWVDPTINVGATQGAVVIQGEPGLQIGYVSGDDFEDIEKTQTFRIVWGLQGGYWSMPHIRVTGIGDPQQSGGATMYMSCLLTSDAGEKLTDLSVKVRLYADEEFLFAPNYPIPVVRAPPESPDNITELDGVGARLECSVRDNSNRSASLTIFVDMAVSS
jgi:hypothetical protein